MLNPGEEFRLVATPSAEAARKLVYLAETGSDAVISGHTQQRRSAGADRDNRASDNLQNMSQMLAEQRLRAARLEDPGYQALSQRIGEDFDKLDEASVLALQQIEDELAELRLQEAELREQAYRDEHGRLIFGNDDLSAAFYEDGERLADEDFAEIKDRLEGRSTFGAFQSLQREGAELTAERDAIHAGEADRKRLREDLESGAVSEDEALAREQEILDALPTRVQSALTSPELTGEDLDTLNARAPADEHTTTVPLDLPSPGGR